jgi:GTP-binding protein
VQNSLRFFDEVQIHVKAGNGGNGCVSFRREKYVPDGGPDGGNGGKGGDIILRPVNNLNTLSYFHYHVHHEANNGKKGSGANKTGASGDDLVLLVPTGTQIWNEEGDVMLFDLSTEGQDFVVAHGGQGGLGNINFKSSTNQAPKFATPGEEGENGWIKLKLKLIADVAIVGFPNSGKSTLISAVTNAKSKIGDYPFTTLKPILGVYKRYEKAVVLCDIPGLIEGAHEGVGLGDKFLKHIERCKAILFMLDVSRDFESEFKTLLNEIELYNADMLDKKFVVALNKIDLLSEDESKEKMKIAKKLFKGMDVFQISAHNETGLEKLMNELMLIVHSKNENSN